MLWSYDSKIQKKLVDSCGLVSRSISVCCQAEGSSEGTFRWFQVQSCLGGISASPSDRRQAFVHCTVWFREYASSVCVHWKVQHGQDGWRLSLVRSLLRRHAWLKFLYPAKQGHSNSTCCRVKMCKGSSWSGLYRGKHFVFFGAETKSGSHWIALLWGLPFGSLVVWFSSGKGRTCTVGMWWSSPQKNGSFVQHPYISLPPSWMCRVPFLFQETKTS